MLPHHPGYRPDKPFHKPECECDRCEEWRASNPPSAVNCDSQQPEVERAEVTPGPMPWLCAIGWHVWSRWVTVKTEDNWAGTGRRRILLQRECLQCRRPDLDVVAR